MKIYFILGCTMAEKYEATAISRLDLAIFRKNVRARRIELDFTRSYMAEKCDMYLKSYSDFENGETMPKGETMTIRCSMQSK